MIGPGSDNNFKDLFFILHFFSGDHDGTLQSIISTLRELRPLCGTTEEEDLDVSAVLDAVDASDAAEVDNEAGGGNNSVEQTGEEATSELVREQEEVGERLQDNENRGKDGEGSPGVLRLVGEEKVDGGQRGDINDVNAPSSVADQPTSDINNSQQQDTISSPVCHNKNVNLTENRPELASTSRPVEEHATITTIKFNFSKKSRPQEDLRNTDDLDITVDLEDLELVSSEEDESVGSPKLRDRAEKVEDTSGSPERVEAESVAPASLAAKRDPVALESEPASLPNVDATGSPPIAPEAVEAHPAISCPSAAEVPQDAVAAQALPPTPAETSSSVLEAVDAPAAEVPLSPQRVERHTEGSKCKEGQGGIQSPSPR